MMKAIAIDDEPLALSVVKTFCLKVPYIELCSTFSNGIDAMKYLIENDVDLMFVDINMPHISGIEMVRALERPPMIIFTTAYQNYALEGFELSAIDYLVKPFSFERFLKGVNRASELYAIKQKASEQAVATTQDKDDYITIKVDYSVVKLNIADIIMVEGLKDYVKVYTTDKRYVTKSTMKNIEERLSEYGFMRVHKSYVVNLRYVEALESNHIVLPTGKIALGNQYKEAFIAHIEQSRI